MCQHLRSHIMIEFCSEKRMFIAISILGGLTLLVLIVESHWTNSASNFTQPTSIPGSNTNVSQCWLVEDYEVVDACHLCSDFEIRSKSIGECFPTQYKEVIQCLKSGKKVNRSCDKVAWLEERNFWIFEGITISGSLLSTLTVFLRQRILNRRMIRRLQRQLANCA